MTSLDLGVIGNCAIASLVDRKGRHVWHGIGRLDGDPVFNALLGGDDPQGGFMDVVVAGAKEIGRQRYLHNTAILETVIDGNSGTVRKSAGTGTAQLGVAGSYPVTLHNTGLIESSNGVLQIFGTYALSNGTLRVAIRSLSDFGRIHFASAVSLSVARTTSPSKSTAPKVRSRSISKT